MTEGMIVARAIAYLAITFLVVGGAHLLVAHKFSPQARWDIEVAGFLWLVIGLGVFAIAAAVASVFG